MINGLARMLVKLGLLLIVAGGVVYLLDRIGLRPGQMPGDLAWRRKNVAVYFPLGTSILLSILLSLAFYLLSRFRR
ncbi:DUF2905 domain-containing protein [Silvibacterium sp.]|uniref:DUF2905 domain-containing protein n=1 Tax=Silvibacterium sp. TaxID=1964179 RepID=UPI0039E3BB93